MSRFADPYDKNKGAAKGANPAKDSRRHGPQFKTAPPKTGQLEGYFTKLLHVSEPYLGALMSFFRRREARHP